MMKRLRDNGGFTLIEIVLVILIMGIVAAVAVGQFGSTLETARVEHTKAELNQLARAITGNDREIAGNIHRNATPSQLPGHQAGRFVS